MNTTTPCDSQLPEQLINFVVQSQWKDIIVITDKDPDLILRMVSAVFVMGAVIPLRFNVDVILLLNNYYRSGSRHIAVFCDTKWKAELSTVVHKIEIYGKKMEWVFIHGPSSSDFEEFLRLTQVEKFLTPSSNVFSLITSRNMAETHVAKFVHQRFNSTNKVTTLTMRGVDARRTSMAQLNSLPLQGYHLKISTFHGPPWTYMDPENAQLVVGGYGVKLLEVLAKYLGFNYTYVIPTAPGYGTLQNGTWTGIVGAVHREEVDIGLTAGISLERGKVVAFSAFTYIAHYVVAIRRPTDTADEWNFFLFSDPFPIVVWITCAAVSAFIFGLMLIFLKIYVLCSIHPGQTPEDYSMQILLWNFVCLLLQADTAHITRLRPSQIIFFTSAMYVLLITKSYLSLLTAHLTLKPEPKQYLNLEEVLDDGKFGITMIPRTSIVEELKNAKCCALQKAWEKIQRDHATSFVSSTKAGMTISKNKDFVHLTSKPLGLPEVATSNCTLEFLKQPFGGASVHLIFPKTSPIADVVTLKILSLRSSGVLRKLQEKYIPAYDPSVCKTLPSMTITGNQIIGIFVILLGGVCLSGICCFLERVFNNKF